MNDVRKVAMKRGPKPKLRKAKDQIEQITVRIGRGMKTSLELVGRDLQSTSINETIQYLLLRALRDYDIDGTSAAMLGDRIAGIEDADFEVKELKPWIGHGMTPEEQRDVIADFFKTTGIYRAANTPERMRTPAERYLLKVWEFAQSMRFDIRTGEQLTHLVADGILDGTPEAAIAKAWGSMRKRSVGGIKRG